MDGGPGLGLHTPAAIRPPPPSQGMAIGGGNPSSEGGSSGPQPTGSMASSMGMSMAVIVGPAAGGEQPPKRKRGRPRKVPGAEPSPGRLGASLLAALAMPLSRSPSPYTPSPEKRGRGRPLGSGKKQQLAALGVVLAGTGKSFTPHILTVSAGEDVSTKIMQFAQHGLRAMCVLSANGAVSSVTLRQQSSSGGTVTYEGRYEILSLSGSYLPVDAGDGSRQRTGSLSVSLAGSDGRVFGGGVAGMLLAAAPIQVVVGSFLVDPFKSQSKGESPLKLTQGGSTSGAATPPATQHPPPSERESTAARAQQGQAALSGSGQLSGQSPLGMGAFQPSGGWATPPPFGGDGRRADINISLAGG